jgi:hypothetical protein
MKREEDSRIWRVICESIKEMKRGGCIAIAIALQYCSGNNSRRGGVCVVWGPHNRLQFWQYLLTKLAD